MEKRGNFSPSLRKNSTHLTLRPPVDTTPRAVVVTDVDDDWVDNVVAAILRCMATVWVGFLLYLLSVSLWAGTEKRHDLVPMLLSAVGTFALQTGDINGWIGLRTFPSMIVETVKVIFVVAIGEDHEATASFVLQFLVIIYVFSAGPCEGLRRSPVDPSVLIVRAVTFLGLPIVVSLHFL